MLPTDYATSASCLHHGIVHESINVLTFCSADHIVHMPTKRISGIKKKKKNSSRTFLKIEFKIDLKLLVFTLKVSIGWNDSGVLHQLVHLEWICSLKLITVISVIIRECIFIYIVE